MRKRETITITRGQVDGLLTLGVSISQICKRLAPPGETLSGSMMYRFAKREIAHGVKYGADTLDINIFRSNDKPTDKPRAAEDGDLKACVTLMREAMRTQGIDTLLLDSVGGCTITKVHRVECKLEL